MSEYVVVTPGKPQAMGSKRAYARGGKAWIVNDDPEALADWKTRMTDGMFAARPEKPIDAPVSVAILIFVKRPQSHYNKHGLKPTAPALPASGRDIDKVARACLDCGSAGGWWRDDSRVSDLLVRRRYADEGGERTEVHMHEIGASDVAGN